jgi:membrane-bound lytic murein transglycosylase D
VASTEPVALGEQPSIVEKKVEAPRRDLLGGIAYDLPVEQNSWVESELDFLVDQRKEVIERWLQRGDYYEDFVKSTLRAYGVPTDLFNLAMIESGFVPTARSGAGAVGLWQFMAGTGRGLGLRIDTLVDERMDPVRSTRAAARHLRGLKEEMGTWPLAAASYNAGTGRISRSLQSYGVDNFWDLAQVGDLAEETKHYVPRLYAMTIIDRRRAHFGIPAPSADSEFAFDSIQVEYATPLEVLAKLGPATLDQLTRLNPNLYRGIVPPGGYWVWVPAGTGVAMQRAWLASDFHREQGYGTYVVRKGDTLGKLAELGHLPSSRIRELNPGIDWDRLQIDRKLKLPYKIARALTERPVEKKQVKLAEADAPKKKESSKKETSKKETSKGSESSKKHESDAGTKEHAGSEHTTHRVKDGETLWAIAHRYGVEVAALQKANGLDGTTIIPGQELSIPN